ncbi:MAG: filamentous hemagglutinin N-terminal domain-containing protein, partial [Hoeflea sp.]|uniref:filamentous hemagglutinin N-terminal domain-containing protein n=1 Tax=Hoeflea sp. TaxID=1940281 RepID=UPI003EF97E60
MSKMVHVSKQHPVHLANKAVLIALILSSTALSPVRVKAAELPTGANVASGQASISAGRSSMLIDQSSQNAIINWNSFSIGGGGTVTFQNGAGATLNRVTGTDISAIDGSLNATGSLFLINQNGIVIGRDGVVQTGGSFVASTLDIQDGDFLDGGDMTFSGNSSASVINLGKVGSLGGDVAFIARHIVNEGELSAPNGTVGLAAGREVLMRDASLDGGKFLVKVGDADSSITEAGVVSAATVELRANGGNIYALAGNRGGAINATGVSKAGGRIFLTAGGGKVRVAKKVRATRQVSGRRSGGEIFVNADVVNIAGLLQADGKAGTGGNIDVGGVDIALEGATLDASGATGGGRIRVGGAYQGGDFGAASTAQTTSVDEHTLLTANAIDMGDGGEVIVWADGTSLFDGAIEVKGGQHAGDGGIAETSGADRLWVGSNAFVNALAPLGAVGDWLLDPKTVTIADGGTATLAQVANAGDTTSDLTIDASSLNGAAANVSIVATETITFNEAVAMTNAGVGLSATAGNLITVNTSVSTTNGAITFLADNYAINADVNAGSATMMFDRVTAGLLDVGLTPGTSSGGAELDTAELALLTAGDLIFGDPVAAQNQVNALSLRQFPSNPNISGLVQFNALDGAGSYLLAFGNQTYPSVEFNANDGLTYTGNATITTSVGDATFNVDADGTGVVGGFDNLEVNDGFTAVVNSAANILVKTPDIRERGTGTVSLNANGGEGTITFARSSAGTIGVGGGTGRFMSFSDVQLTRLTAGTINFGDPTTPNKASAISVNAAGLSGIGKVNFNTSGTTTFTGANNFGSLAANSGPIAVNGTINATGTIDLTANSPITFAANISAGGNITATASDTGPANADNITVNAGVTVQSTGGNLTLNAGDDVILGAGATVSANGTLTLSGGYNDTDGDGGLTFAAATLGGATVNLSAIDDIALGVISAASSTVNINSSSGGVSMQDAAGTYQFANLDVTGTNGINLGATISTSGTQTYNSPVVLTADTILSSTGSGAITFDSTLNGLFGLTVNTAGTTAFNGTIGAGGDRLGSLTTDAGGTTAFNVVAPPNDVDIQNDAIFGDDVTIAGGNQDWYLRGNTTFNGTITSTTDMIMVLGGTMEFNGAVTFGVLQTTGGGKIVINGGSLVTTANLLALYNNVEIGADTVMTSAAGLLLSRTVNGPHALTLNSAGTTEFRGEVGGTTALTSLTTDTGGTTLLNGGTLNITGNTTTFNDAVILGVDTVVNDAGGVAFNNTVDSQTGETNALTVDAGGDVTFGGIVGGTDKLSTLDITSGGTINANAAIATNNGDIGFTADDMTIAAAVNAGIGIVTLAPNTAGQLIDLGGADAPGTLGLTDAELDFITADTLRIGSATAGSITFTDTISPAGISTLSLITGGAIVDGHVGVDVQVANLALQSVNGIADSGDVLLETEVDTIAARNTTEGGVAILETFTGGDLIVGTVDGVVGIRNEAASGFSPLLSIQLETTDGDLTVNSDIYNQRRSMFLVAQEGNGGVGDSTFTNNANIINDDSGSNPVNARIDIRANNITLNPGSTISAANRVILQDDPSNSVIGGVAINLGGADGVNKLGLTNDELNTVTTAGVLQIGHSGSGDISITDEIAPANAATLSLETGGAVKDAHPGTDITISNLVSRTGAGFGEAGNRIGLNVDNFAFSNTAGVVNLSNFNKDLTITALDGLATAVNSGTTTDIEILGTGELTFAVDTSSAGDAAFTASTITVNNGVVLDASPAGTLAFNATTVNLDGNLNAVANGISGTASTVNLLGSAGGAELQDAIDVAAAGATINAAAGTWTNSAQVVFSKDVTLDGAGKGVSIFQTGFNTGSADNDTRGWWLVESGVNVDMRDFTMDGTGQLVWQGIRHKGLGTIDNVAFQNILFNPSADYAGTAVAAFGTGAVDVTNSSFTNIGRIGVSYQQTGVVGSEFIGNTYAGKGAGDHLDYALDIGAGAYVTVLNNEVSDNLGVASSDGSISAGFLVSTLNGGGTAAIFGGNTMTDNTVGIAVGVNTLDTSVVQFMRNGATVFGRPVVGANTFIGGETGIDFTGDSQQVWGDTFADAVFRGQSAFYIRLRNDGLKNPASVNVLDASAASFFTDTAGTIVADALAIEPKIEHYLDDPDKDLIVYGPALGVNAGDSIQRAVNAAGLAAGVQTVTVAAGTFGGSVEVWVDGLNLQGQGATTIIDTDAVDPSANNGNADNGFQVAAISGTSGGGDVTGVTINGFNFDTVTTTGTNIGVELGEAGTSAATDTTVQDNTFNDLSDGIFSNLSNGTTTITGNTLTAISNRAINFDDAVVAGEQVFITGNNAASSRFTVVFDDTVTDATVQISGNTLASTASNDALIFDATIADSNVTIGGATLADANDISGFEDGIDIAGIIGGTFTISGNTRIAGGTGDGIEFEGPVINGAIVNVTNNQLITGQQDGVTFQNTIRGGSTVNITGNSSIVATARNGINVDGTVQDTSVFTINSNTIGTAAARVGQDGIAFAGGMTGASTVIIGGANQVFASQQAIQVNDLQSSSTLSITGGTYDGAGGALLVDNTGVAGTVGSFTINGSNFVGGSIFNGPAILGGDSTIFDTDDVTFNGTLDGAHSLTVNTAAVTTFAGTVGTTTGLASLATDAGGTTQINGGAVTTSGSQSFGDDVELGTDTTITSTGGDTIGFGAKVDGAFALSVNTTGDTVFDGAVGGGTALKTLTTDAGGTTRINGGSVTAFGTSQTYNDAVVLGADTVLNDGGAVTFNNTVDGAFDLAINTTNQTVFNGAVGGGSALKSLATDAGGTTEINGGAVTTTGSQSFGDDVELGADTTITSTGGDTIGFGDKVDGGFALNVNTTGDTVFNGAVGSAVALVSLTTDAGGT